MTKYLNMMVTENSLRDMNKEITYTMESTRTEVKNNCNHILFR